MARARHKATPYVRDGAERASDLTQIGAYRNLEKIIEKSGLGSKRSGDPFFILM